MKSNVYESIGELARTIEKGFGGINSKFRELEVRIKSTKPDFKLARWQGSAAR